VGYSSYWIDQQIQLARRFVGGEVSGQDLGPAFLRLQSQGAEAGEVAEEPREELLNDLLFALSNHTPFDDERLPDQLDDVELREIFAEHLGDFDAGRYDPMNS